MIELNKKTQQDFLNKEWAQKLLDAGVDMSDAKYCICNHLQSTGLKGDYIYYVDETKDNDYILSWIPTYTVSELLYKLHEWIYPTIDGKKYSGGLKFMKDAPFYMWYYELKHEEDRAILVDENYIYAEAEYPIESLAMLLIQCHKKDIGLKNKDTGNISDK